MPGDWKTKKGNPEMTTSTNEGKGVEWREIAWKDLDDKTLRREVTAFLDFGHTIPELAKTLDVSEERLHNLFLNKQI